MNESCHLRGQVATVCLSIIEIICTVILTHIVTYANSYTFIFTGFHQMSSAALGIAWLTATRKCHFRTRSIEKQTTNIKSTPEAV